MAMSGKVEVVLELKSTPEQFYNVFSKQAYDVPTHTPSNIQGVDVHQGDWETSGSIKIWKYTIGGKAETFKEKVELDDETKTITLHGLEGHVFDIYKVFRPVWKLTPKGSGTSANCSIEYEKLNPNVAPPDNYLEFMISLTKDIDAGLSKA